LKNNQQRNKKSLKRKEMFKTLKITGIRQAPTDYESVALTEWPGINLRLQYYYYFLFDATIFIKLIALVRIKKRMKNCYLISWHNSI
jgi:hypothetical protein